MVSELITHADKIFLKYNLTTWTLPYKVCDPLSNMLVDLGMAHLKGGGGKKPNS